MNTLIDHSAQIEALTQLKPYVIGLYVMETRALFGIVDARGKILCKDSVEMKNYPDPTTFVFDIVDRLQPMIEKCGGIEKIKAMGIGASSGNNRTGCIENSANLHWKGKIAMDKMFEGSLGIAVSLRNDATAAAMGEVTYGAAHGLQNFIVVNINGGLGAGIFVNNHVVLGYNGRVGEIGHVTIFPGGRPCGCGKTGCLESYVSARGILANTLDMLKENPDVESSLRDIAAEDLTVRMVTAAAGCGDKLAIEALRHTGELLGRALVSIVSFINPEAIIISGWVGRLCGEYMLEPLMLTLNENLFSEMKWHTRVLLNDVDPGDAPLLYASAVAWDTKEISNL